MALETASKLAIAGFIAILVSLIFLLIGINFARNQKLKPHKWSMITASGSNALFLVFYISRYVTEGNTTFPGPSVFFWGLYLPVLIVHIGFALVSIFVVGRQLLHAHRNVNHNQNGIPYFEDEAGNLHRTRGTLAYYIWGSSFVGGILIFLFLYILF